MDNVHMEDGSRIDRERTTHEWMDGWMDGWIEHDWRMDGGWMMAGWRIDIEDGY